MEQQFILRLPESLQNIDTKLAKITRINQKEVQFCYNNTVYPGIICKLPTILDSHKFIDNKLYKIADISTMVVIFENKCGNIDEEIKKYEESGISPPTYCIKKRRQTDETIRPADVEMIEKKIADLLKEDSRALKVEIKHNEKDVSDDLDLLAAEIEGKMISEENQQKVQNIIDMDITKPKQEKTSKINESNIIASQEANIEKKTNDAMLIDEINQELNAHVKAPSEPSKEINDSILIDLMNKIKEKEEAVSKTLNPILKKRFEQVIVELKEEYEKRKKELEK